MEATPSTCENGRGSRKNREKWLASCCLPFEATEKETKGAKPQKIRYTQLVSLACALLWLVQGYRCIQEVPEPPKFLAKCLEPTKPRVLKLSSSFPPFCAPSCLARPRSSRLHPTATKRATCPGDARIHCAHSPGERAPELTIWRAANPDLKQNGERRGILCRS